MHALTLTVEHSDDETDPDIVPLPDVEPLFDTETVNDPLSVAEIVPVVDRDEVTLGECVPEIVADTDGLNDIEGDDDNEPLKDPDAVTETQALTVTLIVFETVPVTLRVPDGEIDPLTE